MFLLASRTLWSPFYRLAQGLYLLERHIVLFGAMARVCYNKFMRLIITLIFTILLSTPAQAAELTALERELIYRTSQGGAQDVAMLAQRTLSPNLTNELGQPLLTIAASRGDAPALAIVQTLIAQGADVNFGGRGKHFPLIAAIQGGRADVVQLLLDSGADYRAQDAFGSSALSYAQQSSNAAVKAAIEARAAQDRSENEMLVSQENHEKLRYQLAYHSCALQYYGFYYASGQDDIAKDVQYKTLQTHREAITKAMSHLAHYFKYTPPPLQAIFHAGKQDVFEQLEALISNRHRRANGIGQAGDMEKRCEPIGTHYITHQPKDYQQ
jgi:hypothetical protein